MGTSLSDITQATGLTKGAVYGHFSNKEALAIAAFRYNVRQIIHPLNDLVAQQKNSLEKLRQITAYYRNYYHLSKKMGGCPIINVGTDAKHLNPALFDAAKEVASKLIMGMNFIIYAGQQKGEISMLFDASTTARNIYSIIEGGIFTATTSEDERFLLSILDHIDQKIIEPLAIKA